MEKCMKFSFSVHMISFLIDWLSLSVIPIWTHKFLFYKLLSVGTTKCCAQGKPSSSWTMASKQVC